MAFPGQNVGGGVFNRGASGSSDFMRWYDTTTSAMRQQDQNRRGQIQRYYDDILRMEKAFESGGGVQDLFLARNILKEYEKLSGQQYGGKRGIS